MSCQCLLLIFVLDVDECANNTDSCDANSYCNNTVGSYNCTCYPEYTGNGTLCTGNFLYDTSLNHILLLLSLSFVCSPNATVYPSYIPLNFIFLSVPLSVCLFVCLSVCLSVRPSVRLSVCSTLWSCVICLEHFPLAPVTWNNIWSS